MIQISSLFLNDFPKAICLARDIENKYCHDRLGNETVKYIAVLLAMNKSKGGRKRCQTAKRLPYAMACML